MSVLKIAVGVMLGMVFFRILEWSFKDRFSEETVGKLALIAVAFGALCWFAGWPIKLH